MAPDEGDGSCGLFTVCDYIDYVCVIFKTPGRGQSASVTCQWQTESCGQECAVKWSERPSETALCSWCVCVCVCVRVREKQVMCMLCVISEFGKCVVHTAVLTRPAPHPSMPCLCCSAGRYHCDKSTRLSTLTCRAASAGERV